MCNLFVTVFLYVSDTLPSVSLGGDLRCADHDVLCLWCLLGHFAGSARTMERPTMTAALRFSLWCLSAWDFALLMHIYFGPYLPCCRITAWTWIFIYYIWNLTLPVRLYSSDLGQPFCSCFPHTPVGTMVTQPDC
jgi:hypothetical protein